MVPHRTACTYLKNDICICVSLRDRSVAAEGSPSIPECVDASMRTLNCSGLSPLLQSPEGFIFLFTDVTANMYLSTMTFFFPPSVSGIPHPMHSFPSPFAYIFGLFTCSWSERK